MQTALTIFVIEVPRNITYMPDTARYRKQLDMVRFPCRGPEELKFVTQSSPLSLSLATIDE